MKLFRAFTETLVLLTLSHRATAYVGNGVKGVFAHYMVNAFSLSRGRPSLGHVAKNKIATRWAPSQTCPVPWTT